MPSCATLISQQKVELHCDDSNANIKLRGFEHQSGDVTEIFKHRPLVITSQRKGYRSSSKLLVPKALDFGVVVTAGAAIGIISKNPTVTNVVLGGLVTFVDVHANGYRQERRLSISAPIPLSRNEDSELFLYASSKMKKIEIKDIHTTTYKDAKKFVKEARVKPSEIAVENEFIFLNNWLDENLETMGYQESQPGLISKYENNFEIEIEVLSAKKKVLKGVGQSIEMEIVFYICDSDGTRMREFKTLGSSQVFVENSWLYGEVNSVEIIKDAILDGLTKLLASEEWQSSKGNLLTMLEEKTNGWGNIEISKPIIRNPDFKEIVSAELTVTGKEEGLHGSGCFISPEGHFLTTTRVVAGRESFDVTMSNGVVKEAKVIREDPLSHIVLAQVDTVGNASYQLVGTNGYKYGDKVFSVGTPVSTELSQSLFSGIVSGKHLLNGLNYIQTDVKVSSGNSGSPLINTRGELIGVISEKYIGYSLEGISFAVSAFDIMDRFKLIYK
ncbi:MAG: trypsin-like peptidase domain-containing protein [Flavobacteriales bacterium]